MSTAAWIYIGIGLFVFIGVNLIGRWSRKRPNRDPKVKEAIRQPKIIPVIGWIVMPIGILLILVSASSVPHEGDNVPMLVCGIVLTLAAALLITIYVNWYVIVRRDEIVLRTLFRGIKRIRYQDIESHSHLYQGMVPMLKLRSTDGTKIELNSKAFDVTPVLEAIEYREKFGRWRDFSSPIPGHDPAGDPSTGTP